MKRGIHGKYISVEPFHLYRYLDEQTLRYNLRKLDDAGRFQAVLRQIVDKRLTYDELIGKAAMEKQRQEFSQEVQTWKENNWVAKRIKAEDFEVANPHAAMANFKAGLSALVKIPKSAIKAKRKRVARIRKA